MQTQLKLAILLGTVTAVMVGEAFLLTSQPAQAQTSPIVLKKPSCAAAGAAAGGAINTGVSIAICAADLDNTGQLEIIISTCSSLNTGPLASTKIIDPNGTVRATIPC